MIHNYKISNPVWNLYSQVKLEFRQPLIWKEEWGWIKANAAVCQTKWNSAHIWAVRIDGIPDPVDKNNNQ